VSCISSLYLTLRESEISFEDETKAQGSVSLVAVVIKKDSKNHVADCETAATAAE